MGLTSTTLKFEKDVLKKMNLKYNGLNWCELGCQRDMKYGIPAKLIYKRLGVKHISFDINGNFGSLKRDLTKTIDKKFYGLFDVITDYGTLEHIPLQYPAFKNIHDMLKMGGITIHLLPFVGNWENHGLYKYDLEFFRKLAKKAGYEVSRGIVLDKDEFVYPYSLVATVLVKKSKKPFISEEEFNSLDLVKSDSSDLVGNYEPGGVRKILSRVKTSFYILLWMLRGSPVS